MVQQGVCELDVPNYLGTSAIVYGHVHLCCFELYRIQIKSAKHKPSSTCFPISMSPRIRTIELMFIFLHIQKFICEYFLCIQLSEHTYCFTICFFHSLYLCCTTNYYVIIYYCSTITLLLLLMLGFTRLHTC